MHDGMPYGRIQGQGQDHEPIQGSRIENLQSREVDRQSPTGLIFSLKHVHRNKASVSLWFAVDYVLSLLSVRPNHFSSTTHVVTQPSCDSPGTCV